MRKPLIERYFASAAFSPALRAVGQSRQMVARDGLGPHSEPYIEIHLILDGSVHWWVEGEQHFLPPGTVYITKPGELHGGVRNLVQPCSLTWLQIDSAALDDRQLAAELARLSVRQWSGAQQLVGYVHAILNECRRPQPDSRRLVAANLHLFLAHLLRQSTLNSGQPPYPSRFADLLSFIDDRLGDPQPLSIEELCRYANLSRSRLFQLFDQHVGQSPISYVVSHKIETAKIRLLQSDVTVTQLALELGFSTSQHFATVFKRITGTTPTQFRRMGNDE